MSTSDASTLIRSLLDYRHAVDINSFKFLSKPPAPSKEELKLDDEYRRHERRLHDKYGGDTSTEDHFIQVECGFKHTLLLNKRGQVFAFGNGLQG